MNLRVSILTEAPTSGTMQEHWFNVEGDCTWVRFENDSETWVGVFGRGAAKNQNAVCKFSDDKNVFIISGGQGYIVDSSTRKLRHKTSLDYLTSVISVPNKDLVIACEFTRFCAFDTQNLVWRSENVALDGIKLDSSTEDELFGKVWQIDGWYAFVLQYKDWKFTQGSHLSEDWFKYAQ